MTILIFGAGGQLGYELMRQGKARQLDVQGVDFPETDITVIKHLKTVFAEYQPELVINAAAYTDVDSAESEIQLASAVNRDGPANIARQSVEDKVPLIHISTDYVFNGTKGAPYRETDPTSPTGVYGRSKAEGEMALRSVIHDHIILRTAWLYGSHGRNFVKTIVKLAREKEEIRVVSDQYGSPTSAADLAEAILTISDVIILGAKIRWGTYHYCGQGVTSWYEFARTIVEFCRHYENVKTDRVEPIKTSDYPTAARRPAYSALQCDLIEQNFGISTRPWRSSLEKTIHKILSGSDD
jgi:dTDP-4-dehydrorhamnose reductase